MFKKVCVWVYSLLGIDTSWKLALRLQMPGIKVSKKTGVKNMSENSALPERHSEEFAKGFALNGEVVDGLPDKTFTIQKVEYEKSPDLDNPAQMKEKMVLTIALADGQVVDWYPNKTSQKFILANKGYRTANWVGYKGLFYTMLQKVGNVDRKVIYVKDV